MRMAAGSRLTFMVLVGSAVLVMAAAGCKQATQTQSGGSGGSGGKGGSGGASSGGSGGNASGGSGGNASGGSGGNSSGGSGGNGGSDSGGSGGNSSGGSGGNSSGGSGGNSSGGSGGNSTGGSGGNSDGGSGGNSSGGSGGNDTGGSGGNGSGGSDTGGSGGSDTGGSGGNGSGGNDSGGSGGSGGNDSGGSGGNGGNDSGGSGGNGTGGTTDTGGSSGTGGTTDTGGSSGTGGSTSPVGCASPIEPANGSSGGVTDFSDYSTSTGKWGSPSGLYGAVYPYAATNSTMTAKVDTTAKTLHATGSVAIGDYAGTGLTFSQCATVAAFTQVQFTISGSIGDCDLELQIKTFSQTPTTADPPGGCDSSTTSCYGYPVVKKVIVPTSTATDVKKSLSDFSGWSADNAKQVVGVQWQVTAASTLTAACDVDINITNIKFLP